MRRRGAGAGAARRVQEGAGAGRARREAEEWALRGECCAAGSVEGAAETSVDAKRGVASDGAAGKGSAGVSRTHPSGAEVAKRRLEKR